MEDTVGKMQDSRQKIRTIQKPNTTHKKQTTQNTAKQNVLQRSARKRGGLILQRSRAHSGRRKILESCATAALRVK